MKSRRRQLVIHPKFQYRLSGLLVVIILLYSVLYGSWTVVYINESADFAAKYYRAKQLDARAELVEKDRQYQTTFLILTMALVALVSSALGILLSHRIAGPIYHLCKALNQISAGDFSYKLYLRKHDFFSEVADTYNTMRATLQKNFGDRTEFIEGDLKHAIDSLKKAQALLIEGKDKTLITERLDAAVVALSKSLKAK